MHEYASNNSFRGPRTYFYTGIVAVALASIVDASALVPPLGDLRYAAPLSAFAIYALLIFVYDRWGWRWLSTIKNLNGTWTGEMRSSFDDGSATPCVIRVRQTWTRIDIALETQHSRSKTTMAALNGDRIVDGSLQYEFVSEPKNLAPETMQTHHGVCLMDIEKDDSGLRLRGDYFTGRGRETRGEITLRFADRKLMSFHDVF